MQPLGNVENWLCEVEQKMLQSIHWQVIIIIFLLKAIFYLFKRLHFYFFLKSKYLYGKQIKLKCDYFKKM